MYDCIVIGAGPAGIMAAISAKKENNKVILIDKNQEIGEKLKVTGGGRCNITNLKSNKEFIESLPTKNGRFLYSALQKFSPFDIVDFFESRGMKTKVEVNDKVFPLSNKAQDVISTLKSEIKNLGIELALNTEVTSITLDDQNNKVIKTNRLPQKDLIAKNIIIATGGVAYPHTGSTGDGYKFAKELNHQITPLFPTETPVLSNANFIVERLFQGLSIPNAKLSLLDEKTKVIKVHFGDLIFTHFGLSGPCALKMSQFIYQELKQRNSAILRLDVVNNTNEETLKNELKQLRDENNNKLLFTYLTKLNIPKRFVNYILEQSETSNIKIADLSNKKINKIVQLVKYFEIPVHGVKPLSKAFVTGGGINIKEIHSKTMESKLVPGIFFAGETIDLHGYTGGYNITIALATGFLAGSSIV